MSRALNLGSDYHVVVHCGGSPRRLCRVARESSAASPATTVIVGVDATRSAEMSFPVIIIVSAPMLRFIFRSILDSLWVTSFIRLLINQILHFYHYTLALLSRYYLSFISKTCNQGRI